MLIFQNPDTVESFMQTFLDGDGKYSSFYPDINELHQIFQLAKFSDLQNTF